MSNKLIPAILLFSSLLLLGVGLFVLAHLLNGSLALRLGWSWLLFIPLGSLGFLYAANELKH